QDLDAPANVRELSYIIAQAQVQQKEGFKTIFLGSGIVDSLFFQFATSSNSLPSGPIAYTVSKRTRVEILKHLNDLFADDFKAERINNAKTKEHNAIMVAV